MRVLLMAYGSRGDVEPMVGLAMRLRELGAQVRVCAPPDFADMLETAGLPLTPIGLPLRPVVKAVVTGTAPTAAQGLAQRTAALLASAYDAVAEAAVGCDLVVATGLVPAMAAARSVAEQLDIPYTSVSYYPSFLPSPHHPPLAWPGRPAPTGLTDNRKLWELNRESLNVLFAEAINTHRASIGLSPVHDVRDHILADRPLLAADPVLSPWPEPADVEVVQTGAWIRPDERPLPAELEAFLDAGAPPVYVGFGSIPVRDAQGVTRAAIHAVRAQGRRVLLSRGWADLEPTDDKDDCFTVGEVNQQELFRRVAAVVHHGGAGTTTTAARAGVPQVAYPRWRTSPTGPTGWPSWASAWHTTVRRRPPSPCRPLSRRPWRPRPGHGPPPWHPPSVPTGCRWGRSCSSKRGQRHR